MFLKISQNSQENTYAWDLQLYLKETLAQVFPWEFCEIFKNTFFYRTLVVASKMEWLRQKRDDFIIMHHLTWRTGSTWRFEWGILHVNTAAWNLRSIVSFWKNYVITTRSEKHLRTATSEQSHKYPSTLDTVLFCKDLTVHLATLLIMESKADVYRTCDRSFQNSYFRNKMTPGVMIQNFPKSNNWTTVSWLSRNQICSRNILFTSK